MNKKVSRTTQTSRSSQNAPASPLRPKKPISPKPTNGAIVSKNFVEKLKHKNPRTFEVLEEVTRPVSPSKGQTRDQQIAYLNAAGISIQFINGYTKQLADSQKTMKNLLQRLESRSQSNIPRHRERVEREDQPDPVANQALFLQLFEPQENANLGLPQEADNIQALDHPMAEDFEPPVPLQEEPPSDQEAGDLPHLEYSDHDDVDMGNDYAEGEAAANAQVAELTQNLQSTLAKLNEAEKALSLMRETNSQQATLLETEIFNLKNQAQEEGRQALTSFQKIEGELIETKKELTNTVKQLNQAQSEIEKLTFALKQAEAGFGNLQAEHRTNTNAQSQKIQALESDLKQEAVKSQQLAKAQSEIEQLTSTLKQAEARFGNLQAEHRTNTKAQSQKIQALERDLKQEAVKTQQLAKAQSEIEQLTSALKQAEARFGNLQAEHHTNTKAQSQKIAAKEQQLTTAQSEIVKLKGDLKQAETSFENLQTKHFTAHGNHLKQIEINKASSLQIDALKSDLAKEIAKANILRETLTNIKDKAKAKGYSIGHDMGKQEGFDIGYNMGKQKGHNIGKQTGYDIGKISGKLEAKLTTKKRLADREAESPRPNKRVKTAIVATSSFSAAAYGYNTLGPIAQGLIQTFTPSPLVHAAISWAPFGTALLAGGVTAGILHIGHSLLERSTSNLT